MSNLKGFSWEDVHVWYYNFANSYPIRKKINLYEPQAIVLGLVYFLLESDENSRNGTWQSSNTLPSAIISKYTTSYSYIKFSKFRARARKRAESVTEQHKSIADSLKNTIKSCSRDVIIMIVRCCITSLLRGNQFYQK